MIITIVIIIITSAVVKLEAPQRYSLFLIRALEISEHYRKHIARYTFLERKRRPNKSEMAADSIAIFAVFPRKH